MLWITSETNLIDAEPLVSEGVAYQNQDKHLARSTSSACDVDMPMMSAGHVITRAIARGVYEATALPFPGALPAFRDRN
ncbi:hypothetical protein [Tardiphaga sp. OK245]|uniref:hypothetical protein n=1 Tax=Tardiphaga sp. OK245 TaxID=1855306 RepID=UPI00111492AE|nr:hypothetical protein [Tardiphaga sp. OK245]